jgi:hypothetical protein
MVLQFRYISNNFKTVVRMEKYTDRDNENDYSDYRSTPLYAVLIGGIVLSIIGGYLIITNQIANGVSYSSKTGGVGTRISVNGPFTLCLGLFLSILPIYLLNKNKKEK